MHYAHIGNDGEKQTVKQHLENVSFLAEQRGKKINLGKTMTFIGLLHDLGKYSPNFQEYLRMASEGNTLAKRGSVNHSSAGAKYIFENYGMNSDFEKKVGTQLLTVAIASHHGLMDCMSVGGEDYFHKRVNPSKDIQYDQVLNHADQTIIDNNKLNVLYEESQKEIHSALTIFTEIYKEMNNDVYSYHFLISCLERIMLSILVDSDYTDTANFMDGKNVIALNTKEKDNQLLWKKLKMRLDSRLKKFKDTDYISLLRKEMSNECFKFSKKKPGVYRLSIPTGGGKTLASFRYAIEHSLEFDKERIFYIAPFLSILEQNASEIRGTLKEDTVILEHHSNVIWDEKDVLNNSEDSEASSEYKRLTETWDSPIVLTTMVRFLDVLFNHSMQDIRRMHQLANSVIIIDEIQSIPSSCIHIFNTMMNFLTRFCHATIVLCSATQPLLGDVSRKILYGEPSEIIRDINKQFKAFKRTEIVPTLIKKGYSPSSLTTFVLGKMENVDNSLIILNTKSAVKTVYQEIKNSMDQDSNIAIYQLTTQMCAGHRSSIINEISIKLKKNQRLICVSTQLIEAGVDLSFDCVIRSLAGLDRIVQAAGRCNRHGKKKHGYVYIVNMDQETEKLSSLEEIRMTGEILKDVLYDFNKDPNSFDNDLLSPKAMENYYKYYNRQIKNQLDYYVEPLKTTMFDMLSINSKGIDAYHERFAQENNYLVMYQAFAQAANAFEVIGSDSIGLIVPYKESIQLIEELKSSHDIQKTKLLLKKLQRFTVNVYQNSNVMRDLRARHAINESILDGKVKLLETNYYNDIEGISSELNLDIF